MLPDGPPMHRRQRHARRLAQPRPRLQRLGPGLRPARAAGRCHGRPHAGDRHRRPGRRAAALTTAAMRARPAPVARPARAAARRRGHARASSSARSPALPPHTLMQRAGLAVARLALAHGAARAAHLGRRRARQQRRRRPRSGAAPAARGQRVEVTLLGDAQRTARRRARFAARARAAGVRSSTALAPRRAAPISPSTRCSASAPRARPTARSRRRSRRINASAAPRAGRRPAVGPGRRHRQPLGDALRARGAHAELLTLKPGLFTGAGRDYAGEVWFDDLGVDADRRRSRRAGSAAPRSAAPRAPARRSTRAATATWR